MNPSLLVYLCCPLCRSQLQFAATPTATLVETGQLICANGHTFAIEAGIPHMLAPALPGYADKLREAQGWVNMSKAEGWYTASAEIDLALPDVVGKLGWDPAAASVWVGTQHSFTHMLANYVRPGMRVLEIGAARTWAGRYLVAAGCEYTACDLVTDPNIGLGRAKFYMAQTGLSYHVVAGDAEFLPFVDHSFDLVFGVAALHHALNLGQMVREMARVTAPGGIVAGLNEGIRSFLAPHDAASQAKEKGYGINEHVYTLWDYYRAFQGADVRVTKIMRATAYTHLLPPRWKSLLQAIGRVPVVGESIGAGLLVGLLHAYDGLTIYGRKRGSMTTSADNSDKIMADLPNATRSTIHAIPSVANWIDPTPWIDLSNIEMARPLATYIDRDRLPLPAASQREGYHGERHYDYWLSGLKDYLLVKQRLAQHGCDLTMLENVFELGCASGRVLRHFLCQEPQLQVWGSDLNDAHIRWLLDHLGTRGRFFQNTPAPHLPLEDNSMGLVMAFSVFTHIDEYELAWLAELRRVLQPGGIAYITLHTDHTWQILGPQHALYHSLLSLKTEHNGDLHPAAFGRPLPEPRFAYRWRVPQGIQTHVFHAHDYLRTQWARFFTVLDLIPEGSDYQDVILLRK